MRVIRNKFSEIFYTALHLYDHCSGLGGDCVKHADGIILVASLEISSLLASTLAIRGYDKIA